MYEFNYRRASSVSDAVAVLGLSPMTLRISPAA